MHARWRPTAAASVASGLTIGLLAAGMGMAGGSAGPPDRDGPSAQTLEKMAPDRELHRVTLITGDRISLTAGPDQTWRTTIEPAKGRRGVTFQRQRIGDRQYVIPSDVAALVAKGSLDRRLFDVTGLAADGYDDRDAKAIPLIVTYRGKAGRSAVDSPGADQARKLPAINGAAVRVDKKETAAFLESVAGSRAEARLAAGIEKVWLDGKRKPLLEQSVPQIGAPAAWEAGYTGEGARVAVLDGGVEATHPDLTDQVAESKNFSDSPDGDPDGHGTHVAGTVAGTGSASDGRRKGVAPDATILDGKVCEDADGGCFESAILAGMQWAAQEKDADVINLSLGGPDTAEIDPLEEAVNTLTEQTGALFVISAGNGGDRDEPVTSPGSADAALTVGAVDKSDELASFSSRGPRVGDYGVKPDITAPGVDIVAAKAKNAWIGEPVDEQYLRLSGTSMAEQKVAGAAALLAQQHPDWEATELKAALMASAKRHPGQGMFEQGAGRVDVAAAIEQTVFATTPSLSFGTAQWPHGDDTSITKSVTFRNTGAAEVTLELAASLAGPEGDPVPDGSIELSTSELAVPATGEAKVDVTISTNHDGPDGLYAGQITATGVDGASLAVPVSVSKEVESYDLTVRHVGPDGAPTDLGVSYLAGLDSFYEAFKVTDNGEFTVRLPKGRYYLDTIIDTSDLSRIYHLVQPAATVDKDTSIEVDARTAQPVTHSVPNPEAIRAQVHLAFEISTKFGVAGMGLGVTDPATRVYIRSMGEAPPDMEAIGSVASNWAVRKPGGRTPYAYTLFDYRRGGYFTGHAQSPEQEDLATVVSKLNAPGVETPAAKGMVAQVPGSENGSGWGFGQQLPATLTHYVDTPPDVAWIGMMDTYNPSETDWAMVYESAPRTLKAGKAYRDHWNAAVLGQATSVIDAAVRSGGTLEFGALQLADRAGNRGIAVLVESISARLFRNGELVTESDNGMYLFAEDLPAERGRFRLETSVVRDPAETGMISTRVDSVWEFDSAAGDNPDGDILPLWVARLQSNVDGFNAMKRRPVTRLPIRVESTLGKDAAKLRKVTVEVSGDDGKTWRKAAVKRTSDGRYLAVFKTPKGKAVSLRATVADKAGNTAQQTIIAAYLLR